MYSGKLSIPGKLSNELSYVFIDDEVEQQNGSILLFGMFDIKSGSELYHIIIKEAVKHFLDFYHRAHSMEAPALDGLANSSEFLFENSIQYTYEKVSDALREAQENLVRGQSIELRRINCILGAFIDDTLYLSVTGKTLTPFLMYPVVQPHGSSRYVMMNIIEQSSGASPDTGTRLFSNIISGAITAPSSSVIICNQTFLDYIDPQHIKQIISNTPIPSLIQYFKNILSKVNSRADFSALLFSNAVPTEHTHHQRMRSSASMASMEGLNGTEERTHSILTPKVSPYLKEYSNKFLKSLGALVAKVSTRLFQEIKKLFSKERRTALRSSCIRVFNRSVALVSRIPAYLRSFGQQAAGFIAALRAGNFKQAVRNLGNELKSKQERMIAWIQNSIRRFATLSPLSRSLFVLSGIFLFLFAVSLISIQVKKVGDQTSTRNREIIAAIEQKSDLIDASLIYDDKARAKTLLSEAHALINLVPIKSQNRADFKAATKRIEAIDLRLNNIIQVNQPQVLASIPPAQNGVAPELKLVSSGEVIIAYSPDSLYLFDAKQKQFRSLDELHGKIPSISCAFAVSDKLFYFCNGDGTRLYALTVPDETVKTISLPLGESETSLDSVKIYNNRVYVLSKKQGQIFRHLSVSTGYSRGTPWTPTVQESLKTAHDIAIDGKLYVLGDDGNIRLYSAGSIEERPTPEATKNKLAHASIITTNPDDSFLTALNSEEKTILIIDKKTFELSAQIKSDSFTNLQGAAVLHNKNELLVLDSGRLLKIPFTVK